MKDRYDLIFQHFCKDFDWFLVAEEKPKLVFMNKGDDYSEICFYLYGFNINWSKKFFDTIVSKYSGNTSPSDYRVFLKGYINDFFISQRGIRLFESGLWGRVKYDECKISRSNWFSSGNNFIVPHIKRIPK